MKRTNTAKWIAKYGYWKINVQKDGERKSFYSSTPGRNGQREANKKADLWLDEGINPKSIKLSDAYDSFLEEKKTLYSTTEYSHCESIGRVYIVAQLGKKRLSSLCDGDIQKLLDQCAADGKSKKYIQDINGVINKFLKWCRKNKLTTYRPDDVQIPASARSKGKQVLQPKDLQILFSVDTTIHKSRIVKDEYIHAYRFQAATGLRPGELRGVRLEDIDGTRIYIRRAINKFNEETQGKNQNAVRCITLPEIAVQELEAQLREYPSKSGYIFELPTTDTYNRRWQKYCVSNGLTKTTPYELRHTFVSIVKTLPAGEVKQLVGHSASMDTFGIYGHAIDGEDVQTATKVNDLLEILIDKVK